MGFDDDYRWQRRFIPQMKLALAEHLVGESDAKEDREHNTDLVVLEVRALRVACRMRQHEYWRRYGDEFTIRSSRPSGSETELAKVVSGWGDCILYGFEGPVPGTLGAYVLGDLRVFRLWFNRQLWLGRERRDWRQPWTVKTNPDGVQFHAFKVGALPDGFVIGRRVMASTAVA